MVERCAICDCKLIRKKGVYASGTVEGRGHASKHHCVPERFFGRSDNRPNTLRAGIFEKCPWGMEKEVRLLCYDCHELLIHNPVFLPDDLVQFAALVRANGFSEDDKEESYDKLAGRVKLLSAVIRLGLAEMSKMPEGPAAT
jgi:hypothetical protein